MYLRTLIAATLALVAPYAPTATAATVRLDATLSQGIVAAGKSNRVYLRVGLKSERIGSARDRAPLNVALVIDRSGSMSGRKMEEARRAALMAIDRLDRRDIISIVSYDDRVTVEVPATRAGSSSDMKQRVRALTARGSTAIHAGLVAGAGEIRKFKSRDHVNRIILLSDGLANVGPRHPHEFAALGHELGSEGIAVSTVGLGLGFNEDLMAKLARASDGNHAFVQEPEDLVAFFNREFDDAENIVAQDVEIIIELEEGVTPIKSLGRAARIEGNRIVYKVGQLIGGSEQAVLAEIELPALAANDPAIIASARVEYRTAAAGKLESHTASIEARGSTNPEDIEKGYRKEVLGDALLLEARLRKDEAIKLRDAGNYEEARKRFEQNAADLRTSTVQFGIAPTPALEAETEANEKASRLAPADAASWGQQRKQMRQQDGNTAGASVRY